MPAIGPLEILVVLVVAVLVLPPDKIPEAARHVGKTIAAFRRFQSTMTKDFEKLISEGEPERDPTPTLPPKQPPPEADGAGDVPTGTPAGTNGSDPGDSTPGSGADVDAALPEPGEQDDG